MSKFKSIVACGRPLEGRTFYLDYPLIEGRAWDLFMPQKQPVQAAVFFVHGGGWRGGSRTVFHSIIEALIGEGIACATTDYRLDKVCAVEQLSDVRQAYAHFLQELDSNGLPIRPVVFGSSAGGHLALLLALAKPGACGESFPDNPALERFVFCKPSGVVASCAPVTFEPWDEIFPAIWQQMQCAAGTAYHDNSQIYYLMSPINHIQSDTPPVLLMQAENEHLFPNYLCQPFVKKMKECKADIEYIEYKNAEHGFFYDVKRPCQQRALSDLHSFIKKHNREVD